MKVKKLFLPALAAVTLLASCSKDGPDEPVNPVDVTGKAYLSLSLKNNNEAMTRSNEQKPGTEAESKADRVTVLLFDDAFLCLGTADFMPLIFVLAPGAFLVLGYLMVLFNKLAKK